MVTLTGWLGLITFALCLALMVRLPRLAAWLGGLDKQYRAHHLLGLVAYLAVLVHGYAVVADPVQAGDWRAALTLWRTGQVALTGWLAWLLLVLPLFVTFCLPMIRFDRWLLWHRISAAAFIAALWHGASANVPIWALGCVAVVGLGALVLRVLAYGQRAGKRYVVQRVSHPARDVVELELHALDAPLPAMPGAYVYVAFYGGSHYEGEGEGCQRYHPFSISARHGNAFRLSVKALGDCTTHMQHMTVGVAARVQGPFGALFHGHGTEGKQLWVAGGIGIAPFLAQLGELPPQADVRFAYLYFSDADALHRDEIARAQKRVPNLKVLTAATGATGTSSTAILAGWLDQIEDLPQRTAFICGPPGFIDAVQAALHQRNVPSNAIHAERFDFREGS